MLNSNHSIDQAMIEAMRVAEYMRPAIVRPYREIAEIPAAAKSLERYYQDKKISERLKKFSKAIAKQEDRLEAFLFSGGKVRAVLGESFADNKDKVEPRHLDNLEQIAGDLENRAQETSAEGVALLKKLHKQFKILGQEKPAYKKEIKELFDRIFNLGDKATEEVYNMALFLRALRAEYGERKKTKSFTDEKEMLTYLDGLGR
ncbi:hypothetical protein [Candidatus Tokpelaia sp.]|uniref:hypothetical protein n=1 Tax=Candidatus Tokpelaia sp. TaxID=2233777 RepID=UPI001238CD85|nr:hypothetical protein [Candidatus Tokpelaia sp.]KAA6406345.1 hypothetical protein DPQ22_00075 [Candidatus Tokpelaia sp.]